MWNGPAGGTTAPTGYMRKSFNKIPFSLIKWPKGIYSEGAKTMGCQERGFPAAAGTARITGAPEAEAVLIGGPLAPRINGMVRFKDVPGGWRSLSTWRVFLLINPHGGPAARRPARLSHPRKGDCTVGDPANPFTAAGPHWNRITSPTGTTPAIFRSSSPTAAWRP